MAEAKSSAIELQTLERKFMYGMLYLYVENRGDPFTGWVKTSSLQGQLLEIGYLKNGLKEGRWMKWDENGSKLSEIDWHEDHMEGIFQVWHSNGQLEVDGQTSDGEVDGEWKVYYPDGQLASHSLNQVGHLVEIKVWKPDGTPCNNSIVMDGNGSYYRYFPDGSQELFRSFINGKETQKVQY
jgi:antitoxin component YwqK of YwqJK toxin-antitoxin module